MMNINSGDRASGTAVTGIGNGSPGGPASMTTPLATHPHHHPLSLSQGVASPGPTGPDDQTHSRAGYGDGVRLELPEKKEKIFRFVHYNASAIDPTHTQCKTCVPEQTEFADNSSKTAKYTAINFIPLNLFEQFHKVGNLYFLTIAILSLFSISPKPAFVSIAPLAFVLFVSALKEGWEDYQRFLKDKESNSRLVRAFRDGAFSPVTWADVFVGDILKVEKNAEFPADMVLLQSSALSGICDIQTANLDGETNLKIRQAITATYEIPCDKRTGDDYPNNFKCVLQSDPPDRNMDSWKGAFRGVPGQSEESVTVDMKSMLLRGCQLKSDWVIGLVVFTGDQTKIKLQNTAEHLKRSLVDRTVDQALYIIFTLQGTICSLGAILNYTWMSSHGPSSRYLPFIWDGTDFHNEAALSFLTYLVLLDLLVPISLYVSMELVKFTQASLINSDMAMMYVDEEDPSKVTFALARTSNLNEELGQVSYIFSDKTGTLTRNVMEFKYCTVGGIIYGPGEMDDTKDIVDRVPPVNAPEFDKKFMFEDNRMYRNLTKAHKSAALVSEFLTCLVVNSSIIPEFSGCQKTHSHGRDLLDPCPVKCQYGGPSPDEKALVLHAKNLQYYLHYRANEPFRWSESLILENAQTLFCTVLGQEIEFRSLAVLEYSSKRARMTVFCRDPRAAGKIKVYCKGSDLQISKRLNKESAAKDWPLVVQHLKKFAVQGLRTLCLAYKEITDAEFEAFALDLKQINASFEDKEVVELRREEFYEKMEVGFTLIGATAIEDRLQDGVPDTIATLAKANIKLWVLTGDQKDTAINIGRSCKLLLPEMRAGSDSLIEIHVNNEDLDLPHFDKNFDEEAKAALTQDAQKKRTIELLKRAYNIVANHVDGQWGQGLVITASALKFIFPTREIINGREVPPDPGQGIAEKELQDRLFDVAKKCQAVLCCQVSPKQKAELVHLVRSRVPEAITLAIGDGANDCPMIKRAHLGIGISGHEGLSAVMASDYAIAQFKFLADLLLVHGARSYKRISVLILYSFYKNICVSFTHLCFAFYCGFSGQLYFDALCGSLFNMIFTALPVLAAAVFNKDVSKENALKYPSLYLSGQNNETFNLRTLFFYLAEGVVHGAVLFFFSIAVFDTSSLSDGTDNDLWITSTAMFSWLIGVVTFKIGLETTTWVWWSHLFWWGSLGLWFVWMLLYGVQTSITADMYWVPYRLFTMGPYWFGHFVVAAICILPVVAYKHLMRNSTSTYRVIDIIQEVEQGILEAFPLSEAKDGLPMQLVVKAKQADDEKQDPFVGSTNRTGKGSIGSTNVASPGPHQGTAEMTQLPKAGSWARYDATDGSGGSQIQLKKESTGSSSSFGGQANISSNVHHGPVGIATVAEDSTAAGPVIQNEFGYADFMQNESHMFMGAKEYLKGRLPAHDRLVEEKQVEPTIVHGETSEY